MKLTRHAASLGTAAAAIAFTGFAARIPADPHCPLTSLREAVELYGSV